MAKKKKSNRRRSGQADKKNGEPKPIEPASAQQAITVCEAVLRQDPENYHVLHQLGVAHYLNSDFVASSTYLSKALELNREDAQLYLDISNVLQATKQYSSALEFLGLCVELKPDHYIAYNNMGNALKHLGADPDAVLAHYRQCLAINDKYDLVYHNLARLYIDNKLFKEANQIALLGNKKCPNNPAILLNLGATYQEIGQQQEAIQTYWQLLDLEPKSTVVLNMLVRHYRAICDWDTLEPLEERLGNSLRALYDRNIPVASTEAALVQLPPGDLMACNIGFDLLCKATRIFVQQRQQALRQLDFKYLPVEDKIRVGYLSPDFNAHPVGMLIRNMFAYHNRDQFEIFAYYLDDKSDAYTEIIRESCDHFLDLSNLDDWQAASLINEHGIHILVDTSGYTNNTRPQIFDLKPAPIQCNFLGYPGTLGSAMIDYYLTSETYTPPELAQKFTEEMAYLPSVVIATELIDIDTTCPSRAELGLPENRFVFYCFNQLYRIDRKTFEVWLDVLRRAPDAVLWLAEDRPEARQRLIQYAHQQGVKPSRLIFSRSEKLTSRGIFRAADLLLDTLTLTAGTAAVISLYHGVPVLTIEGDSPHNRTCGMFVKAAGLPDMVAADEVSFANKAVELASNAALLAHVKSTLLKNKDNCPLFNARAFAGDLDELFTIMVERWRNDQSAGTIYTAASRSGRVD